jgi:pimeloyl-ACP methyl ester carboxylesterase
MESLAKMALLIGAALAVLLTVILIVVGWRALRLTPLEESVCGPFGFGEAFVFALWKMATPRPDPDRLAGLAGVEVFLYETADKRVLRGYRLRATGTTAAPAARAGGAPAVVLVALGNAMIADQVLGDLLPFRDAGFDVVVYDYRGYGRSDGRSRLKAIIADYRAIVAGLRAGYERVFLYGISFGGVVLLNAVGEGAGYAALAVDGSPARLSLYLCPDSYDPVRHLPVDARNVLVISGGLDAVVPRPHMQALLDTVAVRGGHIALRPDFAHPFMDPLPATRRARLELVVRFFQSLIGETPPDPGGG